MTNIMKLCIKPLFVPLVVFFYSGKVNSEEIPYSLWISPLCACLLVEDDFDFVPKSSLLQTRQKVASRKYDSKQSKLALIRIQLGWVSSPLSPSPDVFDTKEKVHRFLNPRLRNRGNIQTKEELDYFFGRRRIGRVDPNFDNYESL